MGIPIKQPGFMESNIFVFRGSYDVLWTVFYQAFGWQLLLDLRVALLLLGQVDAMDPIYCNQ